MKFIICIAILFVSTVAFCQKAKAPVTPKPDSVVLTKYHMDQLKAFDQQQKDIQTAANILENDRKMFLNVLMGREITERDSVVFDPQTFTVKVFTRKVPLAPAPLSGTTITR